MSTKRAEVFTSNRGVLTGGVYLLGGTNGEKSSLFNSLINSVLCHINVLECIQHAIVLNLPHKIFENIQSTVKCHHRFESEMNLPKSDVSFRYSSGENSFNEHRSFESIEYHYINCRRKKIWVSVQCSPDQYVVFNVMTPPGLGIHLRQPSLLKYLFHLHGSHIEQTSFFNNHIY
ncbi:unnamed protein product [Rotaria sordida]|uniref:Uncharacterized protein n=1 Tax=Rotaria sordida TaxID=392033 RepID=A0A815SG60_9BILA|nr:unnamed protein product [Rotaria sordida]